MKTQRLKQMACISENNAEDFQEKANAILAQAAATEIIMDQTQPFTAYIFYNVSRVVPETLLEVLEHLDTDSDARCIDCPAFVPDDDKRKKRGKCQLRPKKEVKKNWPACEFYYLRRRQGDRRIIEELNEIPYLIE